MKNVIIVFSFESNVVEKREDFDKYYEKIGFFIEMF